GGGIAGMAPLTKATAFALPYRGHPARPPSRRGAGARQLPHDLAVADVRARRCQTDAGRRTAAPALRPAADRLALLGRQPPPALYRRRRRRPLRADAAWPAAAHRLAERRRTRQRAGAAGRRRLTTRYSGRPALMR